ncbi:glutathione S-transferase theta-2 isoform X1 [Takifugu rubripes]|uniref:glutathione S-transferase theta-2 isoform X1 n=1 Tax=Takifugu rubripes TaxID=31033 RepID=UPI0011453AAD|nr:glutathione S-transferase theta-1-like isoform X1 [Takifugu rubripes]XP_029684848.1 glutathione S-transferase theta-1-like isoform X1 [Takifugu rubripes]XP_056889173.1 glutathione S-transferase theta-2 isoform X1 [Takifugu flavidus]
MATVRSLEVYLDLLSQPCRAVHILLTCNRIPHKVQTVALRKGENRTAEFTKLNPMKKVPVMVDNSFTLTESDAILKYLASKYDIPEHWYPWQPERRARVDEYTAWHHTNTRPHAAEVFILEVLVPIQTSSQVDQVVLDGALAQLDDTLDKLESMFLRRQPFLCGDDITVADLLAVCELMQGSVVYTCSQPAASGRDVLLKHPQLQRWRSRVQAAVGDSFHQAHAILFTIRDRHRAKL